MDLMDEAKKLLKELEQTEEMMKKVVDIQKQYYDELIKKGFDQFQALYIVTMQGIDIGFIERTRQFGGGK